MEEDPFRHARAELLEALRIAQEVDDLLQLLLHLGEARHVVPGHGRARARVAARCVFTRGVSFTTRQRKYTIRHMQNERKPQEQDLRYSLENLAHDALIGSGGEKP